MRNSPSYAGLEPSSAKASRAAKGASKKTGTRPELALRRLLWRHGLRYRKNVTSLPGRPDIVFVGPRVAIFCDGDFWHGRNWAERRARLSDGSNAAYWIAKIERNMKRDREVTSALEARGWTVLRFWESAVRTRPTVVLEAVTEAVRPSTSKR